MRKVLIQVTHRRPVRIGVLAIGSACGVLERVGRLKGLGNAVVPQIPELIGRAIDAALESRSA